jgi:ELWxxDGT repeat protein
MAKLQVLFEGTDSLNHQSLWVTDGTAAGTSELASAGAYSGGLFYNFSPQFAALGTKVLVDGYDSANRRGLWVTDGTSAGVSELAVTGAYSGGLFSGIDPQFAVFGTEVLFKGYDTSSHLNLWITDGTSAGTSELAVAGGYSGGLFAAATDPSFTVLGNKVLFEGFDSAAKRNLWVTDGTVAGTSEVQVAGAYTGGLWSSGNPNFVVLGSKALFSGYDASARGNLWVTDGTTAGTSELSVGGSYTSGLFVNLLDPYFTAFGTELLFKGWDTSSHLNLWITDGTSLGTKEVLAAGGNPNGIFNYNNQYTLDPDFTVLAGKVLFKGEDASGNFNLWVTDGTTAGTSELTVAGANAHGILSNGSTQLYPDLTVLGGKALFAGFDSNGHINIWVTDGTSAGTSELIVAGADPSGLFYNNGPVLNPDFTVIGGTAVFEGFDVNGHVNLWVTDGTAAGTSKLAVSGANSAGLNPSDFFVPPSSPAVAAPAVARVALNVPTPVSGISISENGVISGGGFALALADAADVPSAAATGVIYTVTVADLQGLLSAAGGGITGSNTTKLTIVGSLSQVNAVLATLHDLETTAGSDTITVRATDSNGNISVPATIAVTIRPSTSDPFGSGNSGILWRNDSGEADIWATNGTTVTGGGSVGNPGPGWHTIGTGDFNGGGRSGILWQNSSGQAVVWELNGASVIGSGSVGNPGPSWHAVGTGDFNGDGRSDILFQNSSGEVDVWELNGTNVIAAGSVGNPGPSWHAIGTGYFNADGSSDILLQNDSGEVDIWELNGTSVIGGGSVGNPGPGWHALGAGDFNGDGYSDILLQNSSGQVVIWEMNGTTVIGGGSLGNPGPDWHVSAIGDYNGDGDSDILWQNSSGQAVIWEMNGTSVIASASLGNPGPSWRVEGDGSFYRAASADLAWQSDGASILLQNDSGDADIWGTNGSAVTGAADLGNPGPTWHVKGSGDFNGDGNPDLLWQNDSGEAVIWETNGASVVGGSSLGNPGPSWHIAGIGDFNHDGRSDILWQNSSGEAAIWEVDGTKVIGGGSLGNPGPSWHVKGTGDFNGDGFADVLWQNDSGEVVIWELNEATVIAGASLGNPGPSWHALGTGDFNGDGRSDILLQNDSGEVAIWEMNGTNVIGGGSIANPGPSWHVMGTGDYNGDGRSDILWQSSSGDVAVWELNGTSVIGSAVLGSPGPTWRA